MEQSWGYAGLPGEGGILNVSSHEELDQIMIGFPLGPFSEIGVFALADIDKSLNAVVDTSKAMMG
jgi:muconolactone delta-isomerase